jgi:hypothetical protein
VVGHLPWIVLSSIQREDNDDDEQEVEETGGRGAAALDKVTWMDLVAVVDNGKPPSIFGVPLEYVIVKDVVVSRRPSSSTSFRCMRDEELLR